MRIYLLALTLVIITAILVGVTMAQQLADWLLTKGLS